MNKLETLQPVLHNSLTADLNGSEITSVTSEAPALSVDILDGRPSDLQPDSDETLAELDTLVDQDDRVEKADFAWGGDGAKFSVQGSVTRLGLTVGAVLAAFGLVVCNGRPTSDAYVPMALIAGVYLVGPYVEKKK